MIRSANEAESKNSLSKSDDIPAEEIAQDKRNGRSRVPEGEGELLAGRGGDRQGNEFLKNYYEGRAAPIQVKQKAMSSSILRNLEVPREDFTRVLAEIETAATAASEAFGTLTRDATVSKAAKSQEISGEQQHEK